ncbi:hypothetical protein E8E13_005052 [Curvularia kusanoi]|uniref:Apple domain-containing protein n=1 Tax=Curvularia kusanoi TaxID=90978 RepID=A0A9P4THL4_CURKU|nr:hypothetical protein E8E13_005052 [Curvularia kusanoi]
MLFSAVLLTVLISPAFAGNIGRNNYPVRSQCSTQFGGYPVNSVPTSTSTSIVTVTSTKKTTVTPTTSVTGKGITLTVTATAIVAPAVTTSIPGAISTSTDTTTVISTATVAAVTVTETQSTTATTTITTSTVVPAPAGFLPAADTLPGDNLSQRKRDLSDVSPVRRALDLSRVDITPKTGGLPLVMLKSSHKVKRVNKQYPVKVICTTTATKSATVTSTSTCKLVTVTKSGAPTTMTTTITVTRPVTVTQQGPPATVTTIATITSTTTVTPSVTQTAVVTETATSVSYTSTAYAACATDSSHNLVYSAGANSPINGIRFGTGGTFVQVNAGSIAECCSACFADPQCAFSGFLDGLDSCYKIRVSSVAVCAPNALSGTVQAVQPGQGGVGIVLYGVSNGPCGQFNSVDQ